VFIAADKPRWTEPFDGDGYGDCKLGGAEFKPIAVPVSSCRVTIRTGAVAIRTTGDHGFRIDDRL
jgi:hypothetical protein